MGTYGCLEVTIGFNGKERVDYMTYDSKKVFRCYEIKVTRTDFHSKCNNSFVGHYNYYVMPEELFEEVKDEIPKDIGIYAMKNSFLYLKRAAKRHQDVNVELLKDSMIRSLSRDAAKVFQCEDVSYMEMLKRDVARAEKEKYQEQQRYWALMKEVQALYGYHWRHPNSKKTDEEES